MNIGEIREKLHGNNKGSGIVTVLVAVTFLGLLTGMLMFASYGGYKMKLVDKQNKNTFYTVESVLDEINIGLQKTVSVALTEAYNDVMVNYAIYEDPATRNQKFYDNYYKKLKELLGFSGDAKIATGDIANLRAYVTTPELIGDGDLTPSSFEHGATYGAIVEGQTNPEEYSMSIDVTKGEELLMKGIKVSYVNENGAVAMIETDIRIAMPRFNFSDTSAFPDLNNYVAIADGFLDTRINGNAKTNILGNVFANDLLVELDPGETAPTLNFMPATDAEADEKGYVIVKNDIKLKQGFLYTKDMNLWAKNMIVDSSTADLLGDTYLQNDLDLRGKKSNVKLAGTYSGFGSSVDDAEKSSAILINGRESTLDLSLLKTLNICGRGYIGTKYKEKTVVNEEEKNQNTENVIMGESIAVKSDQIAYLIPAEAVCCTNGASPEDRKSVFNSNPITMSQYEIIRDEMKLADEQGRRSDYVWIDNERELKALGEGKCLKDYMENKLPIKIFKTKTTKDESLVYFYMNFSSPEAANQYIRDYYGTVSNKEKIDEYTKIYTKEIKIKDPSNYVHLQLHGNAFVNDKTNVNLISNQGTVKEISKTSKELENEFYALTRKLVPNVEQLKGSEFSKTVYDNIIDSEHLNDVLEKAAVNSMTLLTSDGKKVLITKDLETIVPDGVQLVISEGNVYINKNFNGMVIARGNIIISNGTTEIKSLTLEEFSNILMACDDKPAIYALDFFKDGINYQHSENKRVDYGTEEVSMSDLIVYENWSKK